MSRVEYDAGYTRYESAAIQSWPGNSALKEFLEHDPSPTLLVHTGIFQATDDRTLSIIYGSKSLRNNDKQLLLSLTSAIKSHNLLASETTKNDFGQWICDQCLTEEDAIRKSFLFENHIWSARTLEAKWLLVRGSLLPSDAADAEDDTAMSSQIHKHRPAIDGHKDSIRCFMSEPLSLHQQFVRDFDWSSTSLGSMDTWNSQLVDTVSLTLTNTGPAAVFWGSDMVSVYNEAFVTIAGRKHPSMMGDSPANAFVEVWDTFFEPRIQISRQSKQPFSEEALCLMLERLGYTEETYMTFTFLPLINHTSEVVGFYHTVTEVTQQVLNKRRMSLLLHVSSVLSEAENLDTFWKLLLQSLSESELDTPFVMLYSVSSTIQNSSSLNSLEGHDEMSETCLLAGSLGYASDLPQSFSLKADNSTIAPLFRASLVSRTTTILKSEDGTLPEIFTNQLQTRGYGAECNTVVVCPLQPTNHDAALGFLSVGLGARRPYDTDYQSFINLLIKNICSSLASVVLLEDEKKRGRNVVERAAYESAQLTVRLKEREKQNQIQEHKFMTMMQQVPVGILDLTPVGDILFGNQAWYSMTGGDSTQTNLKSWVKLIHEDDRTLWKSEWAAVSSKFEPTVFEARLAIPWSDREPQEEGVHLEFTWVLIRMSPLMSEAGLLRNVTASFTDISLQKYTIAQQIHLAQEAVEAKQQQDNFVDMTSHEMRNPLNAMLLCARELCVMLESTIPNLAEVALKGKLIDSLDVANTIVYCGQHQLRIIDDILTLSKLDAKLLQINPIETQPVVMAQEVLKLFGREAHEQDITLQLTVQESLAQAQAQSEMLMLDPSRVTQILVNFIANAIKFTKTEKTRCVTVEVGTTKQEPSVSILAARNIKFVQKSDFYNDPAKSKNWKGGKPVYLEFVVRDTGGGISSTDMLHLFNRFAQTRPKTHSHYGGSGLGLFISQRLAELQGGRVGIASEVGVGSSFYFYVKVEESSTNLQSQTRFTQRSTTTLQPGPNMNRTNGNSAGQPSPEIRATRVLIVEDNLVNQKVLKRQLERIGYTTCVANHGLEALDVIYDSSLWKGSPRSSHTRTPLHMIFMDIEMPMMDGRECVKQIREYESQGLLAAHVPVVALTANARAEQIANARMCGFDEVVTKPFQIEQVVDKINRLTSVNGILRT